MLIGRKSTLFLVYGYELDEGADVRGDWKPREIKGTALLPHLDEYVRRGELLRAYETSGDLRAPFGGRDPWTLTDAEGEKKIEVVVVDAPRLYRLDTGYVFMVVGVAPKSDELTLADFQDTAYAIVRSGTTRVASVSPQMQKLLESKKLATEEPVPLRQFFAQLVPGLKSEAPRGTPRTTAPLCIGVILARDPMSAEDRHRLRLVYRSNQAVEPSTEEHGVWNVSSRETCLFSSFGFSWVVTSQEQSQFLADAPHMVRDRYVYKWLLVEHQRLCLLALATECADMSSGLDGSNFAEMRMRLLRFIATYNFRHVSSEERHDEFYKRSRDALMIDDLLAEVREEVVEIDTQLAARRAETLNHVLAFLTLVLTPVGIMCSVFQTDAVPGKLRFSSLVSADAWLALVTHAPFLCVLLAAATGATIYTRIFGYHVVSRLLRALLERKNKN